MDLQNQLLGNAEFSDLFDPSNFQPQTSESLSIGDWIYSLISDSNGTPDISKFKEKEEKGMTFIFKNSDSQKVPKHCQLVYSPILDMVAIKPDLQNKHKITFWIPEYDSRAAILFLVHKQNPDPSESAVVEMQPTQQKKWLEKLGNCC